MRFTVHSYGGYWWIRDNVSKSYVCNKAGRKLTYHPKRNTWESIGAARLTAQRRADKLNTEIN